MGNINTQGGSDVNCKEYGDTPLYRACKEGFYTIAELLIERNAKVNYKSYSKNTPLHKACRYGHTDIVQMLIQHKAIINCKNCDKITPLHFACARRNSDIAMMLIQNGANVNYRDNCDRSAPKYLNYHKNEDGVYICEVVTNVMSKGGATPLHIACAYGHVDITKILIEHGAVVNCEDRYKQTPLHLACGNGHADKAKILINNRATVNCENNYKDTPLHLACKYDFADVVRLLLVKHAEINSLNDSSEMPMYETRETKIKIVGDVKLILSHTLASIVNSPNNYAVTPLQLASESGNINIVKLLLELGADINLADNNGRLPLHYACRTYNNNIDVMKLYLIDLHVDVNYADIDGKTPLHIASWYGVIDNVKFLVEHGADIYCADNIGKLPIHSAVCLSRCNDDVIKFYLDLKINVNCRNKIYGETPLHSACRILQIKTTKFLLDNNADVSIADCYGETALHKVVLTHLRRGDPVIIKMLKMLIDRGADINAKNKSGLTVLDLAKDKQINEATLYLESLIKQNQ